MAGALWCGLVVAPLLAGPLPPTAAASAPPAFVSKIAAFEPKTIQCRVGITVYVAGGVRLEAVLPDPVENA